MIQSARSGKQHILEGTKAATPSKEMEIILTNIGRASLEELLADYCDYEINFVTAALNPSWFFEMKNAEFERKARKNSSETSSPTAEAPMPTT